MAHEEFYGFRNDPTDPVFRDRDERLRQGYPQQPSYPMGEVASPPTPAELAERQAQRELAAAEEAARVREAQHFEAQMLEASAAAGGASPAEASAREQLQVLLGALAKAGWPGSVVLRSWRLKETRFRYAKERTWDLASSMNAGLPQVEDEPAYMLREFKEPGRMERGETSTRTCKVLLRTDGSRYILRERRLDPPAEASLFADLANLVVLAHGQGVTVSLPAGLLALPEIGWAMNVPLMKRWDAAVAAVSVRQDAYAGTVNQVGVQLGEPRDLGVYYRTGDEGFPKKRLYADTTEGRTGASRLDDVGWLVWTRPEAEGVPLSVWLTGRGQLALGASASRVKVLKDVGTHGYPPVWFHAQLERAVTALEARASQA